MIRLTCTFLLLVLLATPSLRAGTFVDQLRTAKHIGLAVDAELGAFTVHVYTPAKFREHCDSLAVFKSEREAFVARIAGYDRARQDAQMRGATSKEMNAITSSRNRDVSDQPASPFDKRIKLHSVVAWGDDYVALAPFDQSGQQLLVPVSRIGRVIRATKKTEASPSAPALSRPAAN